MSKITATAACKRHHLNYGRMVEIIRGAGLSFVKDGPRKQYNLEDVDNAVAEFNRTRLLMQPPAGYASAKHLVTNCNCGSKTMAEVLKKHNPDPGGCYWNGTKFVNFYHIESMKKLVKDWQREHHKSGSVHYEDEQGDYISPDMRRAYNKCLLSRKMWPIQRAV